MLPILPPVERTQKLYQRGKIGHQNVTHTASSRMHTKTLPTEKKWAIKMLPILPPVERTHTKTLPTTYQQDHPSTCLQIHRLPSSSEMIDPQMQ